MNAPALLALWIVAPLPLAVLFGHAAAWADGRGLCSVDDKHLGRRRPGPASLRAADSSPAGPGAGRRCDPLRRPALSIASIPAIASFPPPNQWHGEGAVSRHNPCQLPEIIRLIFPRDPVKRLARALNVPLETARNWTYRAVPERRSGEIADALLAEIARTRAECERTELLLKSLKKRGE